jgi:hypothetical protein
MKSDFLKRVKRDPLLKRIIEVFGGDKGDLADIVLSVSDYNITREELFQIMDDEEVNRFISSNFKKDISLEEFMEVVNEIFKRDFLWSASWQYLRRYRLSSTEDNIENSTRFLEQLQKIKSSLNSEEPAETKALLDCFIQNTESAIKTSEDLKKLGFHKSRSQLD